MSPKPDDIRGKKFRHLQDTLLKGLKGKTLLKYGRGMNESSHPLVAFCKFDSLRGKRLHGLHFSPLGPYMPALRESSVLILPGLIITHSVWKMFLESLSPDNLRTYRELHMKF